MDCPVQKGHVGSALCDLLDCRHYEILPTDLEEVDITDRESVSIMFVSAVPMF